MSKRYEPAVGRSLTLLSKVMEQDVRGDFIDRVGGTSLPRFGEPVGDSRSGILMKALAPSP